MYFVHFSVSVSPIYTYIQTAASGIGSNSKSSSLQLVYFLTLITHTPFILIRVFSFHFLLFLTRLAFTRSARARASFYFLILNSRLYNLLIRFIDRRSWSAFNLHSDCCKVFHVYVCCRSNVSKSRIFFSPYVYMYVWNEVFRTQRESHCAPFNKQLNAFHLSLSIYLHFLSSGKCWF